jgi:hypothetical protein
VKVAGVIKNFHPQNSIEILENIADFRKRIDQAIENKAAQAGMRDGISDENQETKNAEAA